MPTDVAAGFWDRAGTSSAHHGWHTPPWLLEALYPVVCGRFDLDPCSPVRTGRSAPVRARIRFTAEDDALALPWRAATVYLNPPYGRALPRWMTKTRLEQREGRAGPVIALVPARTDTRWWHDYVAGTADVWLMRGRLAFGDGKAAAPFPFALVVWAADGTTRAEIGKAVPAAWHVAPVNAPNRAGPR